MSENEFTGKNMRSLDNVIKEFVLPNAWLQTQPDIIENGGVAIPYLLSKPGAGKTSVIKAVCDYYNFGLYVLHPALKPIEEWGGLPDFKNIDLDGESHPGTIWTISEPIIDLTKLSKKHQLVIMLWDDMHLCGQQHLALMQEAFSERSIRGYKLPDNVALVLAGNDSHKAGHKSLSSAISNRCSRCHVHMPYDTWKKNFAIKKDIHSAIITFLGNASYSKFFHEDEVIDEPWASPRSWTRLSNYLKFMENTNNGQSLEPAIVNYYGNAHIGADASNEFSKYYSVFMKFDVKNILINSENFQMPDDELDHYPLAFALIYYFTGMNSDEQKKLIANFTQVINTFYTNSKALALLMFKELIHIEQNTKKKLVIKIIQEAESNYEQMVSQLLEAVDYANKE